MIDFEPYAANPTPSQEQDPVTPMLSRIDQAIASSNLRCPPPQYTSSPFGNTNEGSGRIPTTYTMGVSPRDSSYTMGQSMQANAPPQGYMPGNQDYRISQNYGASTYESSYQPRYSQQSDRSFYNRTLRTSFKGSSRFQQPYKGIRTDPSDYQTQFPTQFPIQPTQFPTQFSIQPTQFPTQFPIQPTQFPTQTQVVPPCPSIKTEPGWPQQQVPKIETSTPTNIRAPYMEYDVQGQS